jgi:hypothetical protein
MDLELIENQLKQAISIVQTMKHSQNQKTENVDTLKTHLIEILQNMDNLVSETDSDSESDSECDSESECDSDASFTQEELTYIKNDSHKEYLKRYSLKPKFPLHYFKPDRDSK